MSETSTATITFYDIAFRPPVTATTCAPNPWKARYALNVKNVPYKTTWVPMPDIAKVRLSVGVPASRKFADGSDYHTLPMMTDSATDSIVGDSFDIAIHLQKNYPDSGVRDLFPTQNLEYVYQQDVPMIVPLSERDEGVYGEYVRFQMHVDAAFSAHVALMCHGLPFDPVYADVTRDEFVKRAGVGCWDDFTVKGDARVKLMLSFREMLGELAKLFTRDPTGPFLLGEQVSYGDLIVGGWLRMMSVTLPSEEWEEARAWHDGVFGQLHDALKQYADVH
jgi:glutathione S-transferase